MFKFSSKIKYAIIGLCDINMHSKNKPVSLTGIIRRQKVSKSYMERILSQLVKHKVLKSVQGIKGGFVLNKRNGNISLLKIYEIFNNKDIKKNDFLEIKNKKIRAILVGLDILLNKKTIEMLKSIKLNSFPDLIK